MELLPTDNNTADLANSVRSAEQWAMDKTDAMRLFARIVERRSFVAASADLAVPRSSATEAIKQLEARLNVRLLPRTTRHVTPTLDGQA